MPANPPTTLPCSRCGAPATRAVIFGSYPPDTDPARMVTNYEAWKCDKGHVTTEADATEAAYVAAAWALGGWR